MIHADLVISNESRGLARAAPQVGEKVDNTTISVYEMCGNWHWYLGELGVHVDPLHLTIKVPVRYKVNFDSS